MPVPGARAYKGVAAVLATMHSKEQAIAPILGESLGLIVTPAAGLDTDRFGTFSREVERTGSQLDAARAKIAAAFEAAPSARVGIASEGSFGPHPHFPFLAVGRELVLMIDRDSGLELTGHDASHETNFSHKAVRSLAEALSFARDVRFPGHGLIVTGCRNGLPDHRIFMQKNATDLQMLEAAVRESLELCGEAFIETDMRAHRNPTRMVAISRAARDLARRFESRCPACSHRGFDVTARVPGLPCAWCGQPTQVIMAEVMSCDSCGHAREIPVAGKPVADPGQCEACNP